MYPNDETRTRIASSPSPSRNSSDEASFVTGATLAVDGGKTAGVPPFAAPAQPPAATSRNTA